MAFQKLGLTVPEERNNPLENPAVPLGDAANWLWLGWCGHGAGRWGTHQRHYSDADWHAVFTCIRILALSVASLPLKLFTLSERGKIQELVNPLHHLLSVAPNDEMFSPYSGLKRSCLTCALTRKFVHANSRETARVHQSLYGRCIHVERCLSVCLRACWRSRQATG